MKNKKLVTFAFIDATNIIYGASNHGWKVDFAQLAKYLQKRFGVEKILYFAGVDKKNMKQVGFYEKLQEFGYELRLIPVKIFSDGRKKADVDSRMTFELMLYFKNYDNVIVMTGDGDFYWVLKYLCQNKQSVYLIAHTRSTAKELKQLFGGYFTDIEKLRFFIEKKDIKNGADAELGSAPRDYEKKHTKS